MVEVPHIIVCLPASEQKLGAQIAQGLSTRGLHVTLVGSVANLQHLQPFAVFCIGVTGQKRHRSLLESAISVATTAQQPILPLLISKRRRLPTALRELQWSDFTRSFDFGWRELLLALDMEGLSHWPYDPSLFDPDVVLVRAQNGLLARDWQVFRRFSRGKSYLSRYTFAAVAGVMIFSFLAFMINQSEGTVAESAVYLVFGVIFAFVYFLVVQHHRWRLDRYGPIIVVTPHGFLIEEPERSKLFPEAKSYSFAKLQSIRRLNRDIRDFSLVSNGMAVSAEDPATRNSYLKAVLDDGVEKTVRIPAIFNFGPQHTFDNDMTEAIAASIVLAFRRAQKGGTSTQLEEDGSLIFLSYARKDSNIVTVAEIGLRELNLRPWVDRSRIFAGKRWKEEIDTAIQDSSALVLFISPDSMRSQAVQYEVRTALNLGKPIIGVIAEKCKSIPADLRPYIYADMTKEDLNEVMGRGFSTGFMQMALALVKVGVTSGDDNPMYVLARGLMRMPLPDDVVFYGGKMTRPDLLVWLSFIGFLAAGGILERAFLPYLYATCIFILIPFGLGWLMHARAMPEMLVIYPSGFTHNLTKESPTSIAFDKLDSLVILRSTWLWGTRVLGDWRDSTGHLSLRIPAHFRGHHQIAQRLVDAFQQSLK